MPQVTGNEIAPETVRTLASRHANLLMLRTPAADRVADAGGADIDELFLVRRRRRRLQPASEARQRALRRFLPSTANVFGPQLALLIEHLRHGRRRNDTLSARLEVVKRAVFAAAAPALHSNAYHQRQQGARPLHGARPRRAP